MILLLAMFFAQSSFAHTRSESYVNWELQGTHIAQVFSITDFELDRMVANGAEKLSNEQLGAYLAQKFSAAAEGKPCTLLADARLLKSSPGFRRFEYAYECPNQKGIVLHSDAFFDRVPTHVSFARIRTEDGKYIEQILSKDIRDLDLGAGEENKLQNASFFEYIGLGILHILTGPDHIAFLLGLVLISRRLRDLIYVITGFTLGHSATIALAVTGVFRPHAAFIDALIALTIALIGAENIAVSSGKPKVIAFAAAALLAVMGLMHLAGFGALPTALLFGMAIFSMCYLLMSGQLHDAAKLRLVVTLVFGLIHGFAFATDLIEMHLPTGRMAELLFGFNLGVETGQLCIVTLMIGFAALLTKIRLALPRPLVVDVLSSSLVGLGVFWIIGRVYS